MDFTPLASHYFSRIDRRMMRAAENVEASQRKLLEELLAHGRHTAWGKLHAFDRIHSYEEYSDRVPLSEYEDIRPQVMKMLNGERDILWPGKVTRYAQSSGTSGGKSKYIPLTDRSLSRCHFAGGTDVVARYISLYPDSRMFSGKGFILGGSYANELSLPKNVKVGDLSASLIEKITPLANLFRVPRKQTALLEDWNLKLDRLVDETLKANVTNLSGVPSWFLTVIRKVMERSGATEIHQVWPNLEVFFHGGISFAPYRAEYAKLIDPSRMRYIETYNASEGFFALQSDPLDRSMLLLMDTDIFYEFIPLDQLDTPQPQALPAWKVDQGKIYALVISSSNGLWRYIIGDTVRIEKTDPLKITIAGRTKSFINAFGEELMVYNAEAALARACRQHHCSVSDYTAAPIYAADGHRGRHQWLIAFSTPPQDVEKFADTLDLYLTQENSDYQAKRSGNLFLDRLTITVVDQKCFDNWLASTGKLGGQRKIPRLRNDRSLIDLLLPTFP